MTPKDRECILSMRGMMPIIDTSFSASVKCNLCPSNNKGSFKHKMQECTFPPLKTARESISKEISTSYPKLAEQWESTEYYTKPNFLLGSDWQGSSESHKKILHLSSILLSQASTHLKGSHDPI